MEAFKVKTVDTTGAGDSFVGALLHKLIDDHTIIQVNTSILSSMHPKFTQTKVITLEYSP